MKKLELWNVLGKYESWLLNAIKAMLGGIKAWERINDTFNGSILSREEDKGCVMCPRLLNVFVDTCCIGNAYGVILGVLVRDMSMCMFTHTHCKYAANAMFLAENLNDLQQMLDRLHDAMKSIDLKSNALKSMARAFGKKNRDQFQVIYQLWKIRASR